MRSVYLVGSRGTERMGVSKKKEEIKFVMDVVLLFFSMANKIGF